MNKMLLLVVGLMVMSMVMVVAYDPEGIIDISYVSQVPDPVQPGDYVDVRWQVSNLGTEPIASIVVELVPSYPFSLDPGEESIREIRTLDGLQKGDAGYVIKYKVRVDANAVEGNNTVKLRYRLGTDSWTTLDYTINVQTVDANLGIMGVQTTPAAVMPGDPFELQVRLKNLADSVIKDVSLKIDLTPSSLGITGGASTLDTLPFAPVKSALEKKVKNIAPGDETVFTYSMIVYPSAEAKVYKIPIQLSYFDTLGNEFTKNDVVGVVVDADPELSVILEESTITNVGTKGDISVKFVNKGLTQIKFLDVKLVQNDDIVALSSDEVYIGNIDSDDYETADFKVYVRPTASQDLKLPLHLEYMDTANHKHTADLKLDLNMAVKSESSQLDKTNGKGTTYIIIAVVVVIIGIIVWRVIRRRRK